MPGWPWFSSPSYETTSITRSEDWETQVTTTGVVKGEGTSACVAGGTSLSAGGWGFSIGSGESSWTTGDEASNSNSFSVTSRNHYTYSSSGSPSQ